MESAPLQTTGRPRRRPWGWVKRVALGGVVLLVVVLVAALVFQWFASAQAVRRYPPPGQLMDVGGYRLHLRSAGSGSPVVVLDAGLGAPALTWSLVQPEVARFTRVIAYDRAGLGWSERGPADRSSKRIVEELKTLLDVAGIAGPYVLVGHSFGGQNMRLFAHKYPDQVAGLVLADSSHENQSARMPEAMRRVDELWLRMARIGRVLAPLGYARLALPPAHAKLPADLQPVERALMLRTPHVVTMCEELLNLSVSDSQTAGCKLSPDVPLAVLSASRWEVGAELPPEDAAAALTVWRELQADLAQQSTNSFHLVVADSGHDLPFDQPAVVVEAIRAVVEAARTQTSLAAVRSPPKSE